MSTIFINVADLTNPATGRTYREDNNARQHGIPLGTLVELASGARLFVVAYSRDCDGTPLYDLGVAVSEGPAARFYPVESLNVVP